MDDFLLCLYVLHELDIYMRIEHCPVVEVIWFFVNVMKVSEFCGKLAAERPLFDIRDEYNYPKKKVIKVECSILLEESTMLSR